VSIEKQPRLNDLYFTDDILRLDYQVILFLYMSDERKLSLTEIDNEVEVIC
jgi:hypothetical protein